MKPNQPNQTMIKSNSDHILRVNNSATVKLAAMVMANSSNNLLYNNCKCNKFCSSKHNSTINFCDEENKNVICRNRTKFEKNVTFSSSSTENNNNFDLNQNNYENIQLNNLNLNNENEVVEDLNDFDNTSNNNNPNANNHAYQQIGNQLVDINNNIIPANEYILIDENNNQINDTNVDFDLNNNNLWNDFNNYSQPNNHSSNQNNNNNVNNLNNNNFNNNHGNDNANDNNLSEINYNEDNNTRNVATSKNHFKTCNSNNHNLKSMNSKSSTIDENTFHQPSSNEIQSINYLSGSSTTSDTSIQSVHFKHRKKRLIDLRNSSIFKPASGQQNTNLNNKFVKNETKFDSKSSIKCKICIQKLNYENSINEESKFFNCNHDLDNLDEQQASNTLKSPLILCPVKKPILEHITLDQQSPALVATVISSQCPICLFTLNQPCKPDSCDHSFCSVCVCEWAKLSNECPLCRKQFTSLLDSTSGEQLDCVINEITNANLDLNNLTLEQTQASLENLMNLDEHVNWSFIMSSFLNTFNNQEQGEQQCEHLSGLLNSVFGHLEHENLDVQWPF